MKVTEGPVKLPSPLDAIPDMRAAAKWTVASLGAAGAALVTVVPLSVFDRLQDSGDLVRGAIGLVLAVAGVAWAIWHTAEALTPPVTTLDDLNEERLTSMRKRIERSPESFFGPFGASVAELARGRQFHELIQSNLLDTIETEEDPVKVAAWQRALDQARSNVTLALALQRQLLEFTHAWQVRVALRRAQVQTMVGTAAIVIGLVLLMSAAYGN